MQTPTIFLNKLLLVAILLFPVALKAQNADFTIIGTYGKVLLNGKEAEDFSKVSGTDSVTLSDSSYLAMVHIDGSFLELKEKGAYLVKELRASFSDELFFNEQDVAILLDTHQAKKIWGVDIRSQRCFCPGLIAFSGSGTSFISLFGDRFLLNWDFFKQKEKPQRLELIPLMGGDVLLEKKAVNNELYEGRWENAWYDLPSHAIIANIYQLENEDKESIISLAIIKVKPEKFPAILELYEKVGNTQSPLAKLALAMNFEAKKFPIDAYFAYQELLSAYPKVPAYQYLFNAFVERQLIVSKSR